MTPRTSHVAAPSPKFQFRFRDNGSAHGLFMISGRAAPGGLSNLWGQKWETREKKVPLESFTGTEFRGFDGGDFFLFVLSMG